MSEIAILTVYRIEKPVKVKHEAAKRCPHYDEDCKNVKDHLSCWTHDGDEGPFPGVCPFVFGMES